MPYIGMLGLCEHCGTLLNIESMPPEAIDADWCCPNPECRKKTSHSSFGYKNSSGQGGRRWVGPEGTWVDTKPTEDFVLAGGTSVNVRPINPIWR
jgi:hypothetical protein